MCLLLVGWIDARHVLVVLHMFPAQGYPPYLDEFTVRDNVVNVCIFFVCVIFNSKGTAVAQWRHSRGITYVLTYLAYARWRFKAVDFSPSA